jgi:hypothetical protein
VPTPPSPRALHRRRRDAYRHLDRKSQIALVSWTAFTATFTGVRALTWAIRNDVGPFRNVSLGGAHIHHYMWGILLLGVSGGAALSIPPTEDSTTTLASVYGVGAALVVDEFALLLDLEERGHRGRGHLGPRLLPRRDPVLALHRSAGSAGPEPLQLIPGWSGIGTAYPGSLVPSPAPAPASRE